MKFSFKTRKLNSSVTRITDKAKNLNLDLDGLTVFGVSKNDGITVTGKGIGKNLGNYFYFEGQKFAYNPYRINIGSIGFSSSDFKGLISPAYVIFEVDKTIYPEFLLLYLKSSIGIHSIKWYGDRGGVRSSLRFSDLGKIDFPDITYEEQTVFYQEYIIKSEKIEKALIEYNKQLAYISKLRQSILEEAVQGRLTKSWREQNPQTKFSSDSLVNIKVEKERLIKKNKIKKEKSLLRVDNDEIPFEIPTSWEWCKIQEVTSLITDGTHKTPNYVSNGVPFISAQNLFFNYIDFENVRYITDDEYDKYFKNKVLSSGDVLLAKSGTLGISAVFNSRKKYAFYESIALIRPFKDYVNSNFLSYYLNYSSFRLIEEKQKGVGVKHLHLIDIRDFEFAFPPFDEQEVIVQKVNTMLTYCDKLEQEVLDGKRSSEKLKESILNNFLGIDMSFSNNEELFKKDKDTNISREVIYNGKTINMKLVELLKLHGKLHAEDLWKMSEHYDKTNESESIDKFYENLKEEIEKKKNIQESSEKGYLELV